MTEHNKNEHHEHNHNGEHKHHEGCCNKHHEEQKDKKEEQESVTIRKKEYDDLLKAKEAQQKLLYVFADFENFKKRNAKDVEQQLAYANERIIKEILPIVDNLCRAKEHATETDNSKERFDQFLSGIELILKQLKDVLTKFGVKELSAVGEKFNPEYHEAMDQIETDEHDNGTVVNEYQKGYSLNDRIIRPSRVCVSKKKKED